MKKIYFIGLLALSAGVFTSCNDLLDKEPLDTIVDNPEYWNNPTNVTSQCNKLYNNFNGYGTGENGAFYFNALNDDQASAGFANWDFINVPTSSSTWNNPFQQIRACNYIIASVKASSLTDDDKAMFEGIARFNRAYQYYQLVRCYGDVQWIDGVIDPADDALVNGARTNRDEVMDKVLEDLDFAANNIGASSNKYSWSSDVAQALKAEVCLFEGTFCKYRTVDENGAAPDQARSKKYLEEAVNASQAIMNGNYQLTENYGEVYNSLNLSSCSEIIFFKPYSQPNATFGHATIAFTNSTSSIKGINKQAFDSFLFLDGEALANTSMDKSDAVTLDENGKPTIEPLLAVRDKRLSVLIDPSIGLFGYEYQRYEGSPLMTASTGYTIRKFYTPELTDYELKTIGQNKTCAPLYWLAPIYLAYAEAKAELGTISQDDLNKTINKLQKRAGLPDMTLTPKADPANKIGVSDLIWEIRRCRRCELMCDFYRYWDLVRWHQLDKLDSETYPENFLGANVVNLDQDVIASQYTTVNLNGGKYIRVTPDMNRKYNKRYYYYPVPSGQLSLNPNLTQNPGW